MKSKMLTPEGSFVINGKTSRSLKKIDDLTVEFVLPEISVPFMGSLGGLRPIPQSIYLKQRQIW